MKRNGLSLIEVLIVIAIFAVLIGLALPIFRPIGNPDSARIANEIVQMSIGLEWFRNTYGFYPPSRLKLLGSESAYGQEPLDLASKTALRKMFGEMDWNGIDWDGDGQPDEGETILDGAQCLVFFLAGPGGQGFAANSKNPADRAGDRIPMFNFHPHRLAGGPFPRCHDIFGQPYLYFSSNGKPNGYQAGDCPQIPGGPYLIAEGRFANPESFQIIAAGRDGQFGAGSQLGALPQAAHDNMTSFHKGTLRSY